MVKPLVHGGDWIDPEGIMDFPEDVDLIAAVDVEPTRKELRKGTHWVYANFFEPVGTRTSNAYCLQYQDKFDLILTLHPEILAQAKRAVLFPFGTSWIPPAMREVCWKDKVFEVSMICGGKNWMPGHKIRRSLWERQTEIVAPRFFWRSSQSAPPGFETNPTLGSSPDDKVVAFRSMFHLCIENSEETNYFSEKLMDCFVTKTVPIYWGCRNVEDFFNASGIIRVADADEAIRVANALTPEDYHRRAGVIRDNEILAGPYVRPIAERMQEAIMAHLFPGAK